MKLNLNGIMVFKVDEIQYIQIGRMMDLFQTRGIDLNKSWVSVESNFLFIRNPVQLNALKIDCK